MLFKGSPYVIELLTPKQNDPDFEAKLPLFAERYQKILDHGATVSICDNPLGNLHFTAMEVGGVLEIPFDPERTLLHLNSFHRKADFDTFLRDAHERGIRHLLVVSGDGGPRLPKLDPSELGISAKTVTSVELLQYIEREYRGSFLCGVAYNQYEPEEHEREKLRRKLEAGARFVITQPVLGSDASVSALGTAGVPVFAGAWMSNRIEPLCECAGIRKPDTAAYDAVGNLARIHEDYPGWGIYLARLGFKREWGPLLTQRRSP